MRFSAPRYVWPLRWSNSEAIRHGFWSVANLDPPHSTTVFSLLEIPYLCSTYKMKAVLRYVSVQLSLYRPVLAQKFPGAWGFQISKQSAREIDKVSITHRLPLPTGNIAGTHFCEWLNGPQSHSAAGRIMSILHYVPTTEKYIEGSSVISSVQHIMPLFITWRRGPLIFQKSRSHFQGLGTRRVHEASSVLRVTILV
jgi:hypothetical protein